MPDRYSHRQITRKQTLDDALAEKASPAEHGHRFWRHRSILRDAGLKFSQARLAYRPSKKSKYLKLDARSVNDQIRPKVYAAALSN
jgi:hypothetical protein